MRVSFFIGRGTPHAVPIVGIPAGLMIETLDRDDPSLSDLSPRRDEKHPKAEGSPMVPDARKHLETLIGQEIRTVSGRPNTVLSVQQAKCSLRRKGRRPASQFQSR